MLCAEPVNKFTDTISACVVDVNKLNTCPLPLIHSDDHPDRIDGNFVRWQSERQSDLVPWAQVSSFEENSGRADVPARSLYNLAPNVADNLSLEWDAYESSAVFEHCAASGSEEP